MKYITTKLFFAMNVFVCTTAVTPVFTHFCVLPKTDLMKAVEQADIHLMEELIQEGADVNAIKDGNQPYMGYPVLRYAIDSDCVESVALLIKYGAFCNNQTTSLNAKTRNLTLLSHGVKEGVSLSILELLIENGADVNQGPVFGDTWTPLMVAAYYGNCDAVELLLKYGAGSSIQNVQDENKTALDYAQENGYIDIVELLRN